MSLVRPGAQSQNPSQQLQLGNFYTQATRDPLLMAILQAQRQQQQEQQAKAQIMQGLGYGQNPNPMGMIPRGHGILTMEGQAYTRPGGSPAHVQELLSTLLGVRNLPSASGFNNRVFSLDTPSSIPDPNNPAVPAQMPPVDPNRLAEAKRMHRNATTIEQVQRLYSLYPQEMEYLLGGGR